jgi:hypothetical protein
MIQTMRILVLIIMNQRRNLQGEEEKHPGSNPEQEVDMEDDLRTESQRISTSCHSMLIQVVIKILMEKIMRMWTQISPIHLMISRTQHHSLI